MQVCARKKLFFVLDNNTVSTFITYVVIGHKTTINGQVRFNEWLIAGHIAKK